MNNIDFINYYEAMKNLYVDSVESFSNCSVIKSEIIDDGIWNFIYISSKDVENIFNATKHKLNNRTPRFYLLNPENITLNSLKEKYNIYCEDSWFVTHLDKLQLNHKSKSDVNIKVSKKKDEVVNLIMKGFSTGDPSDPYGDLSPTYRLALEKNFGKMQNGNESVHFVAYENSFPCSMATITIKGGNKAYLNNVTTLREYKGKGIAKEVLSYAINYIKKIGVKTIMFATETGMYTEKFYKNLGFNVVAYGYCFEEK